MAKISPSRYFKTMYLLTFDVLVILLVINYVPLMSSIKIVHLLRWAIDESFKQKEELSSKLSYCCASIYERLLMVHAPKNGSFRQRESLT